jgi:hypothetical protein
LKSLQLPLSPNGVALLFLKNAMLGTKTLSLKTETGYHIQEYSSAETEANTGIVQNINVFHNPKNVRIDFAGILK